MEENKDFEKKQSEEQGTQQMPDTPGGNNGDGGKKAMVKLFGHEFDKKKVVMAGLGGLLVLALAGGGIAYAVSQQPEPNAKPAVEQKDEQESLVVQVGVKADGWVKGESSPVIAHIVNEAEGVDYYHAYDANEQTALDVPADGEYEVSFIAPVNKDGSTYEVPEASKVKAGDAADEESGKSGLPFEFKPVAADKASTDTLNDIVGDVAEAVKKGDETLTGEKGSAVIELVKKNIKANPNADEEKVEEESKKAEEADKDSTGDKTATKPADGNPAASGGSQNQGGGSSGNGGSSHSGNSGSSKPQHTHNWVAQTTTVHHDAQYKTVHHDAEYTTKHHDAVYKGVCICNNCGAQFDNESAFGEHSQTHFFDGCQSYHTANVVIQEAYDETVLVKDAYDEQVLVRAAWDETVTTGYKCSSCGAVK